MNTPISISELKVNPAKFILESDNYPVPVAKKGKIKAYLIGKQLYEKIIAYLEDYIDSKAVKEADFKKGKDFEDIAKELNI